MEDSPNPSIPSIPRSSNIPQNNSQQNHHIVIQNNIPNNSKISYSECFQLAKEFIDWHQAFELLQIAVELHPVVKIPKTLHNKLKPSICTHINPNPSNNNSELKFKFKCFPYSLLCSFSCLSFLSYKQ